MSTDINQTIKRAVEALRAEYHWLKPTHAHELVAAHLGYKSKIALKSDPYHSHLLDADEPESFECSNSISAIESRIKSLNGLLSNDSDFTWRVSKIIRDNILPECSFCHESRATVKPVIDQKNNCEQLWICDFCIDSNEEEVGNCIFCGDEHVYSQELLNSAGECPEHNGESYLSPQEQDDWDSYIENVTKDNF